MRQQLLQIELKSYELLSDPKYLATNPYDYRHWPELTVLKPLSSLDFPLDPLRAELISKDRLYSEKSSTFAL